MGVGWGHWHCDCEREIISGKMNDPGEVFQKHSSKELFTHCILPFAMLFSDPHVRGDAPCSAEVGALALPTCQPTVCKHQHPSSCSLVPDQAPQNKHLSKQHRQLLGHNLKWISSIAERPWPEWQDYHTALVFWDSQGHQIFSVDTVCVTNYSGTARAGLLQDKGCVRSSAWPLCPPWCIPQHLNILGRACCWSQGLSTVPDFAKRPGPESDI